MSGRSGWVDLTDEIVAELTADYYTWIENLTEIRERIRALRGAWLAGWSVKETTEFNLDRINVDDESFAMHRMDVAQSVLTCAEFEARSFLPGDPNERFLAAMRLAQPKPSAVAMEQFRLDMEAGRIPGPSTSAAADDGPRFKPRLGPQLVGRRGRR